MLTQPRPLAKRRGRIFIVSLLAVHVPYLGFQRVDDVLPAHEVDEAAAKVPGKVDQLMLWIETDHALSGFDDIGQQELEQIALALAGIAENEDAAVGLVLGAAVKIDDDVGAVAILSDVESVRIGLAGVVERVQIRNSRRGQDALVLAAKHVPASGIHSEKAVALAEQDAVGRELPAHQLRKDLVLERLHGNGVPRRKLDEHGAVHQRFTVLVHGADQLLHIPQIGLRRDRLLEVGSVPVHEVLVLRVLEDAVFLGGFHAADVDVKRHAVLRAKLPQERQLVRAGGIAPQGEDRTVGVAEDIVVGVEPHRAGGDHVEEALGDRLRLLRLLSRSRL